MSKIVLVLPKDNLYVSLNIPPSSDSRHRIQSYIDNTESKEENQMSELEERCFDPGYREGRELRKDVLLIIYADFVTNLRSLSFKNVVQPTCLSQINQGCGISF